jgi:FAD-dependent sensor of blue light
MPSASRDQKGRVMIITRLTYFSRNHCDRPGRSFDDGIKDILIESVANNRRDDITGALIHDHDWFAQVLEGPEDAVSATFERILRDRRHSGLRLVKLQPVAARRFAAWWLAIVACTQDNADLFRQYGESERFNPELIAADRLGDLIEALVARAPQLEGRATWTTRSATSAA